MPILHTLLPIMASPIDPDEQEEEEELDADSSRRPFKFASQVSKHEYSVFSKFKIVIISIIMSFYARYLMCWHSICLLKKSSHQW